MSRKEALRGYIALIDQVDAMLDIELLLPRGGDTRRLLRDKREILVARLEAHDADIQAIDSLRNAWLDASRAANVAADRLCGQVRADSDEYAELALNAHRARQRADAALEAWAKAAGKSAD